MFGISAHSTSESRWTAGLLPVIVMRFSQRYSPDLNRHQAVLLYPPVTHRQHHRSSHQHHPQYLNKLIDTTPLAFDHLPMNLRHHPQRQLVGTHHPHSTHLKNDSAMPRTQSINSGYRTLPTPFDHWSIVEADSGANCWWGRFVAGLRQSARSTTSSISHTHRCLVSIRSPHA